jgi:hypothetical protein
MSGPSGKIVIVNDNFGFIINRWEITHTKQYGTIQNGRSAKTIDIPDKAYNGLPLIRLTETHSFSRLFILIITRNLLKKEIRYG